MVLVWLSNAVELELRSVGLNDTLPAAEPWSHGHEWFLFLVIRVKSPHASPEVLDNVHGVIVGDVSAPTRADAASSVDEDHGDHGHVHPRLDHLSVFELVVQDRFIERGVD